MRRAVRRGPSFPVVAVLLVLAVLPRLAGVIPEGLGAYGVDDRRAIEAALGLADGPSGGSLLWTRLLAVSYQIWFALWSGFGFLRDSSNFLAKYAFDPSGFKVIARALAALCQAGAIAVVARVECREDSSRWPYGAALLAVSPLLVGLARSAQPDSFVLLLAAGAYACAIRFQEDGGAGWIVFSALLAVLAAPGVPAGGIQWEGALLAIRNLWSFGGDGSLGGAAAILGGLVLARRQVQRAALLLAPVAVHAVLLASGSDGGEPRRLLFSLPALALLAGEGFSFLGGASSWRRGLLAALALAPGLFVTWEQGMELLGSDTRLQASVWLAENVPAGSALLLDGPRDASLAFPSKERCLELAERAGRIGSARARLYRAMAARHPGGGWSVYRLQRAEPADVEHLDVRPGLDLARAARVEWVVTSSDGADPRRSRELATFLAELAEQADLQREFAPVPGLVGGPWLRVFRLRR